jgi:PAS domain S-box-containing protein
VKDQRTTEATFRALLEAAPDAMVVVNDQGRITLVNSQAERMFGYVRDDLIGQSVDLLVPEQFRGRHPEHRQRYTADPRPRPMGASLELRGCRRDGSEFPVEISLSPVVTGDGSLVISAIRDISERQRFEEVRREMESRTRSEAEVRRLNEVLERRVSERTAELAASNRELESFTYSVSHDLRAPLRHIDGFGRLLAEEAGTALSEKARHYLGRMREGTEVMGRLVDDLLNLAQVGRQDLRRRPIDLSALADDVVAGLASEAEGRAVEWRIAKLPTVNADPGLMRVVLVNLLANALKYTRGRAPATIAVVAGVVDGLPIIEVTDNGVGFDTRYADKLFGVFQRLHRADQFEGTGVGLATVQRIVHKHGGTIWADSRPGEGATFSFTVGAASDAIEGAG